MKKLIASTLVILCLLAGQSAFAAEKEDMEIPLKQLFSEPTDDSYVVFDFPIEVILLGISEDADWFKVKISYGVGPFQYSYVGWTHIPVGDILAEKEALCSEIVSLLPEKE